LISSNKRGLTFPYREKTDNPNSGNLRRKKKMGVFKQGMRLTKFRPPKQDAKKRVQPVKTRKRMKRARLKQLTKKNDVVNVLLESQPKKNRLGHRCKTRTGASGGSKGEGGGRQNEETEERWVDVSTQEWWGFPCGQKGEKTASTYGP